MSINIYKKTYLFLFVFVISCATPQQLINQNIIYKGMQKSSLWNAMVDMNFGDDITLGGCYRNYFPETNYEILGSSSGYAWYVFENVTVPASVSNCGYKGNGSLEEVFYSFNAAYEFVKNKETPTFTQPKVEEKNVKGPSKEDENQLIPISSGTGFFINNEGYLVTNYHVIEICQYVAASINGEFHNLKIIASDIVNDLALTKVENFENKNYLSINVEGAELGDNVIAAGFPLPKYLSDDIKVTRGIISSMSGRNNNYSQYQIDAAVQSGNSGGPLLDSSGNLIGVVVSQLNKVALLKEDAYIPENINYAVKSQNLRIFLDSNKINFNSKSSSRSVTNRQIASYAQDSTLMLICFNTLSNLKEIYDEETVSSIFTLKDFTK